MFILGILSLVQITFLPGLIVLRLLNFRGSFWQSLIYAFALSLLTNYCVIFCLAALNLYLRPIILTLFALQAVWAIWLYREVLNKPIYDIVQNLWTRTSVTLGGLFPPPEDEVAASKKRLHYFSLLFTLMAFCFALDRIGWAYQVFVDNIGTILDGWDAVYSWNRWAQVWFEGDIPMDSRFYPQLVPANWSLSYVFMGDSSVQLFAKSIMPIFVIGILLQLFDLGITFRQPGYFIAILVLRSMLVRFIGSGINNGYVDTAVAFFGFLPVYTLIKAQMVKTETELRALWTLGFLFAAASAVTKQAGLIILLVYPLLLYVLFLYPNYGIRLTPAIWRNVMLWGGLILLVPVAWYGLKFTLIAQGSDVSEILDNAGYAAQAYGNVGLQLQIAQALQRLGVHLALFPLIGLALPWLPATIRWLTIVIILPFPIIWAIMASYDTRNLALFLPVFALASGLAVEALFHFMLRASTRIKVEKWTTAFVMSATIGLLCILAVSYPESRIREVDMTARQELFSPSLNRELQQVFTKNPQALILTNYPVEYISGRKNSQVIFWYLDPLEFERLMENDNITHLLVPSVGVNSAISSQIDEWSNDGYLTFMLQDRGSSVIPYRLYVINH